MKIIFKMYLFSVSICMLTIIDMDIHWAHIIYSIIIIQMFKLNVNKCSFIQFCDSLKKSIKKWLFKTRNKFKCKKKINVLYYAMQLLIFFKTSFTYTFSIIFFDNNTYIQVILMIITIFPFEVFNSLQYVIIISIHYYISRT